jgi:hypothetical protein
MFENPVPALQKTHSPHYRDHLFKERIAVCSKNHTKPVTTLCLQSAEYFKNISVIIQKIFLFLEEICNSDGYGALLEQNFIPFLQ